MSDESPRSAHGNPPPQGSGEGVPSWWADLGRGDLPDDPFPAGLTRTGTATRSGGTRRERAVPTAGDAPAADPARSRPRTGIAASTRGRLANAATLAIVVLVAVLATWVGLGDASARGLVVVALVFGVPTILTIAAVSLVVRRGAR
jgi:hypothetical protein